MRVRYVIPIIVGLLILAVVLIVWMGRRPAASSVQVALVGTTNDSSGTLLYQFRATNRANRELIVSYQTVVPLPAGKGEHSAMSQRSLFVFNALIPIRSSRDFSFPAPEEAPGSWRVLLFYEDPQPAWRAHINRMARSVGLSRRVVNDAAEHKVYSERIHKP